MTVILQGPVRTRSPVIVIKITLAVRSESYNWYFKVLDKSYVVPLFYSFKRFNMASTFIIEKLSTNSF